MDIGKFRDPIASRDAQIQELSQELKRLVLAVEAMVAGRITPEAMAEIIAEIKARNLDLF